MTTQTCRSCGKRGKLAGDYDGQCEACYRETMADWFGPDPCTGCGGSGEAFEDDITLTTCDRCGGNGEEP
jgi:hypothetical protein